ncbi:hypothetical protein CAJAP_09759 [Camponotus japonicus]
MTAIATRAVQSELSGFLAMDDFEDNLLLFLAAMQVFELRLYNKSRKKKTKCWINRRWWVRPINPNPFLRN